MEQYGNRQGTLFLSLFAVSITALSRFLPRINGIKLWSTAVEECYFTENT